jgi:glyoxylase-like metal-dependent hydrolase (beta-lactamase superfamily II)
MKFSGIEIQAVSDGTFKLDGGAMFGVVPKTLWKMLAEPDDENRILLALDCLLVRDGAHNLLLECGIGDKFAERFAKMYAIDRKGGLIENLIRLGVDPSSITDVAPSHLHFDHAGFMTRKDVSGNWVPTFPNAKYHFQEKHLAWANNPSFKDRASFRSEDFDPIVQSGLSIIHAGEWALTDNVKFFVSSGHTPYQQHAILGRGGEKVIFCGDLIPTSAHLKLAYNMGYDNSPVENSFAKEKLLEMASLEGSLLYFYHDPAVKLASVKKSAFGYEIDRTVSLSSDLSSP